MVLLCGAVCTKAGKVIVSRQFMEISRPRIEGLLAAFPKLMSTGTQHTFVETENVRYVYQPMEQLYMLLITTKNSNILEDLETLRLFAKVVPEYCRFMTEGEVADHAFELIFAFDEIIALGYRESVNLSLVRKYIEMDSHDENIHKMVQKNKEREAKEQAKLKARELTALRKESRGGGTRGGFGSDSSGGLDGGYGGGGGYGGSSISSSSGIGSGGLGDVSEVAKPAPTKKKKGKGMSLGGKTKKSENFVDKLIAEGQSVDPAESLSSTSRGSEAASSGGSSRRDRMNSSDSLSAADTKDLHIKIDERIKFQANRDGGLEEMEVKGVMNIFLKDPSIARFKVYTSKDEDKNIPYQTHPQIDKKKFANNGTIGLKKEDRPFPDNQEVGVVKWRFTTADDEKIPLAINCWPTLGKEGAEVNIDYELQQMDLELTDVVISIPLPAGTVPSVNESDGTYEHDSKRNELRWHLPVIDESNAEGSIEFSVGSADDADEFFPVDIDFQSSKTYAGLEIDAVRAIDDDTDIDFSSDISFSPDSYTIV
eukprot:UC4_evm6s991